MSANIIMICYNVSEKMVILMKFIHYINGRKESINNNLKNLYCKNEKKYKFFLDNITNYIYITDRLIFIRENEDYKFELEISNKSNCKLTLNSENKTFNINVLNASYKEEKNYLDIRYELETDIDSKHHIILEIEE